MASFVSLACKTDFSFLCEPPDSGLGDVAAARSSTSSICIDAAVCACELLVTAPPSFERVAYKMKYKNNFYSKKTFKF
jgi:hypothetical protein